MAWSECSKELTCTPRHLASRDERLHEQQRLVLQRTEPEKIVKRIMELSGKPFDMSDFLVKDASNLSTPARSRHEPRQPSSSCFSSRLRLLGDFPMCCPDDWNMFPGECLFSDILRTAGVLSGQSLGRSRWRRTMRGRKFGRTSHCDEHAAVRTVRPYRDRREAGCHGRDASSAGTSRSRNRIHPSSFLSNTTA